MTVLDLLRPEIRDLVAYQAASSEVDAVRLNANETPWREMGDKTERGLNRYPPARPMELTSKLAARYGVAAEQLLVTRGSSEAIDLIVRSTCRAGEDNVLVLTPGFAMYEVYAKIQGAGIKRIGLVEADDFRLDADRILNTVDANTRVVFLCSPNNPTGNGFDRAAIDTVVTGLAGRAIVVIDEAYREFSDQDCVDLLTYPHVALLRTLSKAYGLAGIRCGALLSDRKLIAALEAVLPPYTFPTPCIELAMASLEAEATNAAEERVRLLRSERVRLAQALADLPGVERVFPSDANFLLVRVTHAAGWTQILHRQGILIRRFNHDPSLEGCLRITVGRPEDNDRLLEILAKGGDS
jgi:histidinol-phosphate aminotransferase